ncbi:MAG: hypothetical protein WA981_03780 [Glaciecola sp.]
MSKATRLPCPYCGEDGEEVADLEEQLAKANERVEELEVTRNAMFSLSLKVSSELHTIRNRLYYLREHSPESIDEMIRLEAIKLADSAKQLRKEQS